MTSVLTAYDKEVLVELQAWKRPKRNVLGRWGDRVERAIEQASDLVPGHVLESISGAVIPALNQVARESVAEGLVVKSYRRKGISLANGFTDIEHLSLEQVERVARSRRVDEAAKGGVEGAVAGFYGLVAIPADVVALLVLALRSINHRAVSYGFDPATDTERAYALQVLEASSTFGPSAKRLTRAALDRYGREVLAKESAQLAVRKVLEKMPARLALRLSAVKVDAVVPVMGSVVAGGFNGWFLQEVAKTSRFAYRERFLLRRYGADPLHAFGL